MDIQGVDASTVVRNWWVVLLRGITGVLFGVCTLFAPGISLVVLVLLFGAYAFTDGILALVTAVRGAGMDRWWVLVFQGLCGIGAAAVALAWPGITVVALVYVVAAWAFLTGGLEVAAAIRLRRVLEHGWLFVLSGVLSFALGLMLAVAPVTGALVLVLWIGAYALISGVLLTMLAFRLQSWRRALHEPAPRPAHAYS